MKTAIPSMYSKELSYSDLVQLFCRVAIEGLSRCYRESLKQLPYTSRLRQGCLLAEGDSLRYAAICQIGIQRWLEYHDHDKNILPDLWPAMKLRLKQVKNLGDMALCIWAAADSKQENLEAYIRLFHKLWQNQKNSCNAVELGWIVQACVTCRNLHDPHFNSLIVPILEQAYPLLEGLYNPKTRLFRRNYRGGRFSIDRYVSCFADQVYPILALAAYGRLTEDTKSIAYAAGATDSICHYQGMQGQWMWHYDTKHGKVSEEYPVFSVHQHGMAPMAIMASDKVSQTDHSKSVERGMRWLLGENEMGRDMVCLEQGVIWRDIERRELFKMSRFLRGLCCVADFDYLHHSLKNSLLGYTVNYECRPYELGWILYAWADYESTARQERI